MPPDAVALSLWGQTDLRRVDARLHAEHLERGSQDRRQGRPHSSLLGLVASSVRGALCGRGVLEPLTGGDSLRGSARVSDLGQALAHASAASPSARWWRRGTPQWDGIPARGRIDGQRIPV